MQPDRGCVGAVADHRDHLPPGPLLAARDQRRQERTPDPGTGYGWVVRSATPNLQLVGGPDYTPQPRPPGLVGVADTTAFRFRATETGNGTIEFAWSVPPGAAPQPDRVVRYDVTIGPNLWNPTDYFGTVGLTSARTPGNSAIPPGTPVSSESPGTVK